MNYALGDMVPAALAVALSPFPIIAIVIVLSTPRARTNGPLFALGWVLGLVAVSTVVVLLLGNVGNDSDAEASTVVSVLRILLGAALLVMAARQWTKRPGKGQEPKQPPWMATVEGATPRRTLVLGLALAGANPKNLALTLAASASISRAGLDATGTVVALAVFVTIGSFTVLGAVLYYLIAGDRAAAPLAKVKQFMLRHNNVIMMVILLALGFTILAEGIAGLLG
jgi:threonine/homoserine/homoserine lactone efflux protein